MKQKRNLLIGSAVLLVVVVLVIYYRFFYVAPVSWEETYRSAGTNPYDLKLLYALFEKRAGSKEIVQVKNSFARFVARQDQTQKSAFVSIGYTLNLSQADADSLFSFAAKGNDVLLAANQFPVEVIERLHVMASDDEDTATDTLQAVEDEMATHADSTASDTVSDQATATESKAENATDTAGSTSSNLDSIQVGEGKWLYGSGFIRWSVSNQLRVRFAHPKLRNQGDFIFRYLDDFRLNTRNWYYFNDFLLLRPEIKRTCLAFAVPGTPVFYRYAVGKGFVYLHAIPQSFTNLYLREKSGFDHANRVFAHLKPNQIFWDQYHTTYHGNTSGSHSKSPLSYILSVESLRWAWYLALFGLVVFLFLYGRRRQKPIAVLPNRANTSIEFVQTLARFFYKDSSTIADIKGRNLRMYIWTKYRISSDLPHPQYVAQIAQYSGLPENKISNLFELLQDLRFSSGYNEKALAELQQAIEYFYQYGR